MSQTQGTFHIKFKISGSKEKIDFFHWLIGDMDADWPLKDTSQLRLCKVCGGMEYVNPTFGVKQLRQFVEQIHSNTKLQGVLRLKIKTFKNAEKCLKTYKEKSNGG